MRRGTRRAGTPESSAFPTRPYDLIKEVTIALVLVAALTAGLAALFSSPDEPPVTLGSWSRADSADFTATAVSELGGTSTTAQYGPRTTTHREPDRRSDQSASSASPACASRSTQRTTS